MRRLLLLAALPALALLTISANSADSPSEAPRTLMNMPGKLLMSDSLGSGLGKSWNVAKGKYEAVDGGTRGAEVKSDMHGAVARLAIPMKDVVVQYSFKFDGATTSSLSFNGEKGHIGRVAIRPTGLTVQKDDQDGKNGKDKSEVLDTKAISLKPGEWHTLVVELRGPDILATLDGTTTAYGTHAALDKPKANVGFTVAGESVSFKNLSIWDATPSKEWDANKAKLRK